MLQAIFPGLAQAAYEITSPKSEAYNCIAWAAGDVRHWWWPVPGHQEAAESLVNTAVEAIDSYLTQNTDNCVFDEPAYRSFNYDLNAFLKWEKLGRNESDCPRLRNCWLSPKWSWGRRQADNHPRGTASARCWPNDCGHLRITDTSSRPRSRCREAFAKPERHLGGGRRRARSLPCRAASWLDVAVKGSGAFRRNGPKGAAHKRLLPPFSQTHKHRGSFGVPLVASGNVIYPNFQGRVYVMDAATGDPLWERPALEGPPDTRNAPGGPPTCRHRMC